ncbi:MAG: hypothetical protein ACI8RD_006357 [Bacillariaceae sp.]|jgi:hypothetical protein
MMSRKAGGDAKSKIKYEYFKEDNHLTLPRNLG